MSDPLLGLAVRFIEQGGLWVIVGLVIFLFGVAGWVIKRLFDALEAAQAERTDDYRQLAERAITAVETARTASEAMARAVESNGEVSKAMHLALGALKEAVDMLARVIERRSR